MFHIILVLLIATLRNVLSATDQPGSGSEKVSIVFNDYCHNSNTSSSLLLNELLHKVDDIDKMLRNVSGYNLPSDLKSNVNDEINKIKREKRVRGKYVGCFPENPRLNGFRGSSAKNSIPTCIDLCRSGSYVYAAMQAGAYCGCGNTLIDLTNVPARCDILCASGKAGDFCGGWNSQSVYETGLEEYILDEEGIQMRQSYIEPNKTVNWDNVNNNGYTA